MNIDLEKNCKLVALTSDLPEFKRQYLGGDVPRDISIEINGNSRVFKIQYASYVPNMKWTYYCSENDMFLIVETDD